jgi:hypothetical protein
MSSSAPEEWFAFAPGPAVLPILPPPSRRLGAASLVLGLVPFAGYAVVLVGVPFATMWEQGMFAGLGWFLVGIVVVFILSLLAGVPAIILGIMAIRQHRGYGLGVAGLVLGSLAAAQGLLASPGLFWLL